jgi:hypothetical protein
MEQPTTADRIAMYVGGGLFVLGSVVIGAVETLFGSPHAVTGDGQIVHEALVPLELRSAIVLSGLVVWMLYAVYKLVSTEPTGSTGTVDPGPAD